ncbi:MAG: nucleoside 2-deoxyribosyltransferase [Candidatus Woesearchaeota archaeon]
MKIYFAGSITGSREDVGIYLELIRHLRKYGRVLTEHVGDKNLTTKGEVDISPQRIYQRDMEWLKEADVLIAEVTSPGHGVGIEIGTAISQKKPILCLFRTNSGKNLSTIIKGCPHLKYANYLNLDEAKQIIDDFIQNVKQR